MPNYYIPTRGFSANVGDNSTGSAGPDAIESDIDKIVAMMDPGKIHTDSTPGGIHNENCGNFTIDQTIADAFANTGSPGKLMSLIAKAIKALKGNVTNWYDGSPTLTGHTHTGGANDAPKVSYNDLTNLPSGYVTQVTHDVHVNDTSPHSATSTATASRLILRDASGRAKVAAPAAVDDIARKDTVDGIQTNLDTHAALTRTAHGGIQNSINAGTITQDPNVAQDSYIMTNHVNCPDAGASYWHIQTYFYNILTGNRAQIAVRYNGTNDEMYIRSYYNPTWTTWKRVWHSGNDGAGNGLDADTLDGKHANEFPDNIKVYGNVTYADSLTVGQTLTKNIALGASTYKHGIVVLSHGDKNKSVMVFFGTDSTKTLVSTYRYVSGTMASHSRRAGQITDPGTSVVGTNISIKEVYINGSNLEIRFYNDDGITQSLNCSVDWEVWM